MALQNWWDVVTPHRDIVKEGKISEATFAADLGDVVSKSAPLEYKKATKFFQMTYLTKGLRGLLGNVLSRLSSGKGDPVIQLQTPFGGGKTHALLALYHAVKNWEEVKHLGVFSNLPEPKNAKVAVFVGTRADAIKGKTPWGEIAYQLGMYEKVKEHDEKRRSPGKDLLNEVLGNEPVLILIDELVEYAVKAKDFEEQIFAFSQEITEAVKSKERCCLVCTLPSSAPYGEPGERALSQFQRIFGRVESIYTPVEGIEIYEVIRKRLFDDIGEEKIREEVAESYFNLYRTLGQDVPSEVKEIDYKERIKHAYPFHPELIDVLYERWGSYSTFQRTRGVLRLLAMVVADLYKNKKFDSPLIHSIHVNLRNQEIRREFIKHIGNEYDSVIAADIAGENANAPRIDRESGSDNEKKHGIASSIATSVFLYSFSAAGKEDSPTLPRIRVAVLREGMSPGIIDDTIDKLEKELWYFHSKNGRYAFMKQPNLNRVILNTEETILKGEIDETLKETTKEIAGNDLEVYIWPAKSSDIPDNKNLKLAILSHENLCDSKNGEKLVNELFEKSGEGHRAYRNTLFILAMNNDQYTDIAKFLRQYLAISKLQNNKDFRKSLSETDKDELEKKFREAKKDISYRVLNAYRNLALLDKEGLQWKDLGIPPPGAEKMISSRVKKHLIDSERIISSLSPKFLRDKAFAEGEKEKKACDIYELTLKTPGMPVPESEQVLLDAIKKGKEEKIFAVKEESGVYHTQEVTPTLESTIVKIDEDESLSQKKVEQKIEEKKEEMVKNLTIKAVIPWDKISDIVRYVIQPLSKDKAPEIIIEIKAESNEGFDTPSVNKVEESLKQINAKILDLKKEKL